ncbi:MAG: thioesterase family protein [Oligoflexales bacterium]|nr:thioesterase family protein [Oligoflexales bacterium]
MAVSYQYKTSVDKNNIDLFGHMNNAAYLIIFEKARWAQCEQQGVDIEYIKKTAVAPVVLEAKLRFRKELRLGEKITIENELVEYKGKIGRFDQKMYNEHEILCCEASFSIGLMDLNTRKLVPISRKWAKYLSNAD